VNITAPSGTVITGNVTTSKTGIPTSHYGTGSAQLASACNYNNVGTVGTGAGKFCSTVTGTLGKTTATAAPSTTVGTYGADTGGTYGSVAAGVYGADTGGAFGTTTVGTYGSTTVKTPLYASTASASSNTKNITTTVLHVAAITNAPTSGRLEVVTSAGTAVVSYTGSSTASGTCGATAPIACFTGVAVVSGSGTVSTGAAVNVPKTVHNVTVLPVTSATNFQTTAGGQLKVTLTPSGSAIVNYTSETTTTAICGATGTVACFTGVTLVGTASGKIASLKAVNQVDKTIGTGGTLHAAAVTNFPTGGGTLAVTTSTGVAKVSYTGTSTATATCGVSACFTGVVWHSGAKGIPTVSTGHIKLQAQTVSSWATAVGVVHAAVSPATDHFTSTGTISIVVTHQATVTGVPTTVTGRAVLSYTGVSTTAATCGGAAGCFTGVTFKSGTHGTQKTAGGQAITQVKPTVASITVVHATTSLVTDKFTSTGTIKVTVTPTGTAILGYTGVSSTQTTCGSADCFTGVTFKSGTHGTVKAATTITQLKPTVSALSGGLVHLAVSAITDHFTSAGTALVTVTPTGTALVSYTGTSTTQTTCGSAACLTGVTFKSGTHGTVKVGGSIVQPKPTLTTGLSGAIVHAAAVTGFATSGSIRVAETPSGTALLSYTGVSSTQTTCGSAACFTGVSFTSGTSGPPKVGGPITQGLPTVSTFTGAGSIGVASVTGFHAPGLAKIQVTKTGTKSTAWITYGATATGLLKTITTDSGSGTVTTLATGVSEAGPGGSDYNGWTTYNGGALTVTHTPTNLATATSQSTVTSLAGGNLPVVSTTTDPFTTSGTLQVNTTTGIATLSYTGISGNTFTGVKYVSGAKGHIYKGTIVVQTTVTAIHGAAKVNGQAVSGWTWAVTATGKTSFPVSWNGSSCQNNTGTPHRGSSLSTQRAYGPCLTAGSPEKFGIDGAYILVAFTVKVVSTGTITVPGLGSIGASVKTNNTGITGIGTIFQTFPAYGTTLFSTLATSAPGISLTSVDPAGPTATLSTPSQGAVYSWGKTVKAAFSCSDPTSGVTISSCTGVETWTNPRTHTVANGASLTTSTLQTEIHTFKVTAVNSEGRTSVSYATFITLANPPVLATQPTFTVTSGGSVTVPFNYTGTYPATHSTEAIVTPPAHGTATIQPTGKITYHNNNSPNATDSFKFSVSDTVANPSNVEVVNLNVQNQNKPTITIVTPTPAGHSSYTRGAVADATFSCGDTVQVISCRASQSVTGSPTTFASGTPFDTTSLIVGDTHTLKVTAVGFGGSLGNQTTTQTVTYTVVTPHPVASNFTLKMPATAGTITVHALTHVTSTFPVNPGTLKLASTPAHGTATVTPTHVIKYTPTETSTEVFRDTFSFNVKDTDSQLSNTATVGVTVYPVPVITSISRSSGPLAGGTRVNVFGTGFTTVSKIHFDSLTASAFTVLSPTEIVVTSPPHAAGTAPISVTTPGGTSATVAVDHFTYVNAVPKVSGVSPSSGPAAGGTTVTVSGTNLTGATAVYFGTTKVSTGITVNANGTQLTVKSPPGTAGSTVDVEVATTGGAQRSAASAADKFTFGPTVSAVTPSSGPPAGGSRVTINGSGLGSATGVKFGSTSATFTVTSTSKITATSPAHAIGAVTITVVTPAGTTPVTPNDVFTYAYVVPKITSFTPTSGAAAGGTTLTIVGTGFTGATTVSFGSSAVTTTIAVNALGTQLTVKSPPGTSGSAVSLTVKTPAGSSTPVGTFTYGPTISAITPVSGPPAGGTKVTINGSGFTTVGSVKFGGSTAVFTVTSASKITATAPAHAVGAVTITATTAGGTTPTTPADVFTYAYPKPILSGISPNSGPAGGGTTVTVSGTGFTGATSVSFGATSVTTTISVNAAGTQLTVKSPPGTSGSAVSVKVTTLGGTSTTVSAGTFTYGPTISSVTPTSGPPAGGTKVTINGSGFTTVSSVKFGATAATAYTVTSASKIVATSPAHAAGTVTITVTTAAGMTPTGADGFKYVNPKPIVSSISPTSGAPAGGTTVTVNGTGFTGATAVSFGAVTVTTTITVNATGTQLTVKSPAGTAGSAVSVKVHTPGGVSTVVAAATFTYGPTISSLSRTTGPVAGGTKITITGTGFTSVSSVKFGATTGTYTVTSSTKITVTSPAHAAGTVTISVATAAGTTPSTPADKFTYH